MDDNSTIFDLLVWMGALISVLGLAGLIWCIVRVSKARRAKLPDEELRAAIQAVLPLNLGALFLSILGLMLVVIGVTLR
jgi:hypothetical protein